LAARKRKKCWCIGCACGGYAKALLKDKRSLKANCRPGLKKKTGKVLFATAERCRTKKEIDREWTKKSFKARVVDRRVRGAGKGGRKESYRSFRAKGSYREVSRKNPGDRGSPQKPQNEVGTLERRSAAPSHGRPPCR